MGEPIVTISGQRVYPRGQAAQFRPPSGWTDARDAAGRPIALTEMSPSGWASGGNEEAFEAGLPFLAALVAVVAAVIGALLILRRRR